MTKSQTKTLGQKIDTLLEPLYEEAEQHRATIALVKEQQEKLQQQIDAAEQGLSQIESKMAQVVRAMANDDPVIAALVGDSAAAPQTPEPAAPVEKTEPNAAAAVSEPEPEPEDEPAAEPEATVTEPASEPTPQPEAASETSDTEAPVTVAGEAVEATAEASIEESADSTPPAVELDPVADAAAVNEAVAILDTAPAQEQPKIDLTAAAERAAAAAKQLREKSQTN